MTGVGERAQDRVRIGDGGRHQFVGLAAGIAEHDALVAGTLVLVARGVHPLGDVGRLSVDVDVDPRLLPVEARLLVADLADAVARHFLKVSGGDGSGTAHFAGEHHKVGGAKRLDRDPGLGLRGEIHVDDGVRDAIANLVGMALGHRFAGEQVIGLGHLGLLPGSRAAVAWPSRPAASFLQAPRAASRGFGGRVLLACGAAGDRPDQLDQAPALDGIADAIIGARKLKRLAPTQGLGLEFGPPAFGRPVLLNS